MRWLRESRGPAAPSSAARARPGRTFLHQGPPPPFADDRATLFDTARPADAARLSGARVLSRLVVEFPGADPGALDPELALLVFVGDLAAPVARVRIVDLLRQGGQRPLRSGAGLLTASCSSSRLRPGPGETARRGLK
jgi:hypothetical protein